MLVSPVMVDPWESISMAWWVGRLSGARVLPAFPLSTGLMASLRRFSRYKRRRQAMGSYHPKRIAGAGEIKNVFCLANPCLRGENILMEATLALVSFWVHWDEASCVGR